MQDLFSSISSRYDFLNSAFSFGTDRFWRRLAAARMPERGPYLDLCAGTLELSLTLLSRKKGNSSITAVDFCPAMLKQGMTKLSGSGGTSGSEKIWIVAGDGERLPLKENWYQGIMIGFGLRNLSDREAGLREMLRVLKPGGRLVILEFSNPSHPFFRFIYYCYFCYLLPPLGNIFSKGRHAFDHLRDSVLAFPDKERLASLMENAGFVWVHYQLLTFGIAALHWGEKPQ